MTIRYFVPDWKWRPPEFGYLSVKREECARAMFLAKLDGILRDWDRTPYMNGQQCKGAGTDCVRFVCAVLDELYDRPKTPIETLPHDAAMHTRRGAIGVMRTIRRLYMPNMVVKDGRIEPGDVIVTGPHDKGPGHALIVGPRPNELWHATGTDVHRTGLGFVAGTERIFRVYRMKDRGV